MAIDSDLTFITNEGQQTLLERFNALIKNTEFFDVLVGYFYTSGFHAIYPSLEGTEKIRILIGISTNKQTYDLIEQSRQIEMRFSHAETKEHFSEQVKNEMEHAEDSKLVEEGVLKFLCWLQEKKLEIKAYPVENIHAKLYIMTFSEDDRDTGRVITGSSNFTRAGLVDNLEFNVELKDRGDYQFAKEKFEALWKDAVDVGGKYVETVQKDTWLNNNITPYQLYLKLLYEYFKDQLHQLDEEAILQYRPDKFKQLEYQRQAVMDAKKILDEYGGVFLSDVVGLGKTYMSAMLAGQLDGRTLVLAPPTLLYKVNPGSWPNVFSHFRVHADYESLGKLDQCVEDGVEKYDNVFIDEAHRFRNEANITYEKLAQICRGKRVVLVTATPFNNKPKDILSQIKLFQNAKKSTIPGVPNLEAFFNELEKAVKRLDRQKDRDAYMQTIKANAHKIRESVLKYLMVRRTRKEIENYFSKDLEKQKFKFPEVKDPRSVYYQLNEKENEVFDNTVKFIANDLTYARYKTMTYYEGPEKTELLKIQSQNMGRFMKILLIKRLESSFHAFRQTVSRFIQHYEQFLQEFEAGNVYISKKHINKIFELLDDDNEEAIQELLDSDKATRYPVGDFKDSLKSDLEKDLQIFKEIRDMWKGIKRDPKLLAFVERLSKESVLKQNKLIVFTESKETANYLEEKLSQSFPNEVLAFTGGASTETREVAIDNFDARARHRRDDYRILITTEVLSEGVNLHRSNVVINYDIPWNPTRLMQRVGRINRVDTDFDEIYSFNFFPTKQSNAQIKLEEAAKAKIQAFITLLGADARLLTESEDVESHELFNSLISQSTITGEDDEDDSELKYLKVIRDIRAQDQDLFESLKHLPKKARTARKYAEQDNQLLTYFRKGKLQKFFLVGKDESEEIGFMSAAQWLEADSKTPREKLPTDFYDKLEKNRQAFNSATSEEEVIEPHRGQNSSNQLRKILKAMQQNTQQYTDEQETYLEKVIQRLEEGALPSQTINTALKKLKEALKAGTSPLNLLANLQSNIPDKLLQEHRINAAHTSGPREIILSEYLIMGK